MCRRRFCGDAAKRVPSQIKVRYYHASGLLAVEVEVEGCVEAENLQWTVDTELRCHDSRGNDTLMLIALSFLIYEG